MKLNDIYDAETMHAMGAKVVAVDYKNMYTIIEPDIDISQYQTTILSIKKKNMISKVRDEAARRINDVLPDWKARRHRDQVELGVTTTLTAADYTAMQQKCQAIRDASNTIESEIQALTDSAAVENFDVVNHSAWPV